MSDTIPTVLLSHSARFVRFADAPEITASALYPPSDSEEVINAVKRQICIQSHQQALGAAVTAGRVTPLNPVSYAAEPWRTHASLRRALMSRADFESFAHSLHIAVDDGVSDAITNVPAGQGVTKNRIMGAFNVKHGVEENLEFWGRRLRDPPDWLKQARLTSGGKGGIPALWDPVGVACALLDHKAASMTVARLDAIVRSNWPERFVEWQEASADRR